jgi:hypothetical protein
MVHRDSAWRARHNDLGMHVQASDGRGNDPTSCVLLNLCMVYMLKGMEELTRVPPTNFVQDGWCESELGLPL